ncbi:hypothetical protein HAX54_051291, partial [Datura stramonium]|nr:hypothetical protein [Datura stramonium]
RASQGTRCVLRLGGLAIRSPNRAPNMLEYEVAALRDELDRRREMILPMDFYLNIPPMGQDPVVAGSLED